MVHDNKTNNGIQLKRSALKKYAYPYKSEHSFKIYRGMKDLLKQKSEKNN